jgi:hypothetical protein
MSQTLNRLTIDHDFAPGAAPSGGELALERLADLLASPEFSLMALGVIAPAGVWILVKAQMQPRREAKGRPSAPASAPPAAHDPRRIDFGALRRSRMPEL